MRIKVFVFGDGRSWYFGWISHIWRAGVGVSTVTSQPLLPYQLGPSCVDFYLHAPVQKPPSWVDWWLNWKRVFLSVAPGWQPVLHTGTEDGWLCLVIRLHSQVSFQNTAEDEKNRRIFGMNTQIKRASERFSWSFKPLVWSQKQLLWNAVSQSSKWCFLQNRWNRQRRHAGFRSVHQLWKLSCQLEIKTWKQEQLQTYFRSSLSGWRCAKSSVYLSPQQLSKPPSGFCQPRRCPSFRGTQLLWLRWRQSTPPLIRCWKFYQKNIIVSQPAPFWEWRRRQTRCTHSLWPWLKTLSLV